MLPFVHRMRKPQDFQRTRRTGRKFVSSGLVIHISQGIFGSDPTRVGITVGKDCGNSVARHRISRRIRGAVQPLIGELPSGSAMVIKALPTCDEQFDVHGAVAKAITKITSGGAQ